MLWGYTCEPRGVNHLTLFLELKEVVEPALSSDSGKELLAKLERYEKLIPELLPHLNARWHDIRSRRDPRDQDVLIQLSGLIREAEAQ